MRVGNAFSTWHSGSMQKKDKAAPEVSLVFAHAEQGAPLRAASLELLPKDTRSAKRRRISSSSSNSNGYLSLDKLEDGKSLPSVSTLTSVAKANGIHLPSEEQSSQEQTRDNSPISSERPLSENAEDAVQEPKIPSLSEPEDIMQKNQQQRTEAPEPDVKSTEDRKLSSSIKENEAENRTVVSSSSWFSFGRREVQPELKVNLIEDVTTVKGNAVQHIPDSASIAVPAQADAAIGEERPIKRSLSPMIDEPLSTTPQSSPPSSSWFGPIFQYLNNNSSAHVNTEGEKDAVHVEHTLSVTADSSEDLNETAQAKTSNTSSHASGLPVKRDARRPQIKSRTDSKMSSVDDYVPKLNGAGPVGSMPGLPPTILIGSSSSAALGLPVMMMPKSPLQVTAITAENQDSLSNGSAGPASSEQVGPDLKVTEIRTEARSSDNDTTNTKVVEATFSKSSSWWSYVGLGLKQSPSDADAKAHIDEFSNKSVLAELTHSESQSDEFSALDSAEVHHESPEIETSPSSDSPQVPSSALVSSRTKVFTTTTTTTYTSWYNPLNWMSAQSLSLGDSDQNSREVPAHYEGTQPNTEAQMIKEEALPRDKAISSADRSQSDSSNPLVSTASTNSKGWMWFFSSQASQVKSITEKGEKGSEDMEVMNIDEEDLPPANDGESAQSAKDVSNASVSNEALVSVKQNDSRPGSSRGPKAKGRGRGEAVIVPPTTSDAVKNRVIESSKRSSSVSSKKSIASPIPRPPNLVLPTFEDIFNTPPRSIARRKSQPSSKSTLKATLGYVTDVLFARDQRGSSAKGKERETEAFGDDLPRVLELLGQPRDHYLPTGGKAVVIGVHGWFPGFTLRTMIGEPTGTSTKFANMMFYALKGFAEEQGIEFKKITKIPLEGEGMIMERVQKLYNNLTKNQEWMEALHEADAIFFAAHSQGTIVSTHLIHRLILDGHLRLGNRSSNTTSNYSHRQRVCCLALCGIHLGPLAYLHKSSLVQPYIQYFESAAASELFEFQDTESQVSKDYVNALKFVLNHRVKFVYVASLNDQVVPIYSGICSCASHPLILRALYIDGDAYHSSDFLTNLIVLLLRIRNAGLPDARLLFHLSEATAGSLNGVGHSTIYEEPSNYTLAVRYLFLVDDGHKELPDLDFEDFNARSTLNDYEIPWSLRDLVANRRVEQLFSEEISKLRDAFDDWQPKTAILRDLKRKLEPIRRLKLTSRL